MLTLTFLDTKELPKIVPNSGIVCFIESRPNSDLNGYIKIDTTTNFQWYVEKLIEDHPYLTILLGYIETTAPDKTAVQLRQSFAEFHHRGAWFKPGLKLLDFIRDTTKQATLPKLQSIPSVGNNLVSIQNTKLLSTEEIAQYLNVSVPTIRRWIEAGKLPVVKHGKVLRFYLPDVIDKLRKK